MPQCKAITKHGTRCKLSAAEDSEYCHHEDHQGQANGAPHNCQDFEALKNIVMRVSKERLGSIESSAVQETLRRVDYLRILDKSQKSYTSTGKKLPNKLKKKFSEEF